MSNYAPMSDDEFDPANLDPGIRATVLWLRERGFKTCDSGDGKTKIEAGYNDVPEGESAPKPGEVSCEAMPVPHAMVADAMRLADALREVGVELDAESARRASEGAPHRANAA